MGRKRTQELGPHQDFAKRFKEALRESGLSPDENSYKAIGKELGVSATMVGNMLHGDKLPGLDTAIGIALRTGFCVEYLITGRGPIRPYSETGPEADAKMQQVFRLVQGKDPGETQQILELLYQILRQ